MKKEAITGNCFRLEVPADLSTTETVVVATIGPSETNDKGSASGMESSFIRLICREATAALKNQSVLLPHLTYRQPRCSGHFPTGIYIGYDRLLTCICEFLTALADSGFRKILLAGSDTFLLSTAARMICRNTDAVCQALGSHELIERAVSMQNAAKRKRSDAQLSTAYKQMFDNHGSQLYEMCVMQLTEIICDFGQSRPDPDN